MKEIKGKIWFAAVVGILAISCASLLIRWTQAPALTIAAYRVSIASGIFSLFAFKEFRKADTANITKIHMFCIVAAGFALAAHFGFWITSLFWTSVASSVTIVNTAPVFVAALSKRILREAVPPFFWFGVGLTIIGTVVLTGFDFQLSGKLAIGDLLALFGALALAAYLIITRWILSAFPFFLYIFFAYGIAGLVLICLCVYLEIPTRGFSFDTYGLLFLIAIVPQCIGHSIFNWVLKFLPAFVVALLILGEPVGATILAALFLNEVPNVRQLIALVMIGSGIVIGSSVNSPLRIDTMPESH